MAEQETTTFVNKKIVKYIALIYFLFVLASNFIIDKLLNFNNMELTLPEWLLYIGIFHSLVGSICITILFNFSVWKKLMIIVSYNILLVIGLFILRMVMTSQDGLNGIQ